MKFAYADPPYLGCGKALYGDRQPDAADYDRLATHAALVERLEREFPDGWAMSLSTSSLWSILPLCPEKVRIGAWVKPFCSFKPNVNPAYAWEPVIWRGGRKYERYDDKARDWVAANITMRRSCPGAKPEDFCFWVFSLLNAGPGDELVDVFPGSGAVGRAWSEWQRRQTFLSQAESGDMFANSD